MTMNGLKFAKNSLNFSDLKWDLLVEGLGYVKAKTRSKINVVVIPKEGSAILTFLCIAYVYGAVICILGIQW